MLYVITAVHNRYKITQKFVKNFLSQSYKDKFLILVDDGSTDGTAEMVKSLLPNVSIIKGNGNLYWGGALNKAYKWICNNKVSDDAFVMFANDDTEFQSNYFENAINLLKNHPNTLICGCGYSLNTKKLVDCAFNHDIKTGHLIGRLSPDNTGNCSSTRSLFFRVKDFKKIGGFHPIMLPHYLSDYEWTLRASKKGLTIRSFKELKYYYNEDTTGDNDYSKLTLKQLFSKRSNYNPFYKLSFIFLTTPLKYIPHHLFYQFRRYISKTNLFLKVIRRRN